MWTVTPMVWDGDLSWDGLALKAEQTVSEQAKLFSNHGLFLLDSDESEPASLWVTQAGAELTPMASSTEAALKNFKITTALAYHDYRNTSISAKAGTDPITRESDNSTGIADFNQLNPSVEIGTVMREVPFSVFGDWVHNTSGPGDGNEGFAIGAKIGKATVPWSLKKGWEAGYMFERLEPDAAFDEFVDSDFGGGGTNRRGHCAWLTVAVLKNSTVGLKCFFKQHQITGAKAREDRAQLDWVTKF